MPSASLLKAWSRSKCIFSSRRFRRPRAKTHLHAAHETAIYQLSGISGCWYGERMEHHAVVHAGDFFYILAGVPHIPYNPSADEPCVAVIARTDPNEQESLTMRPDLDALPDWSKAASSSV